MSPPRISCSPRGRPLREWGESHQLPGPNHSHDLAFRLSDFQKLKCFAASFAVARLQRLDWIGLDVASSPENAPEEGSCHPARKDQGRSPPSTSEGAGAKEKGPGRRRLARKGRKGLAQKAGEGQQAPRNRRKCPRWEPQS